MNTIERLLDGVPRPEGFVAARVVDVVTGQVLATVGDPGPASAAELAELLAGTVRGLLGVSIRDEGVAGVDGADAEGDVEDLVVTTAQRHHVVRLLPGLGGADAFLLLSLDRARGNLALARHLVRNLETAVVA